MGKPLEKTRLKILLFYTYYENHLYFVYVHFYIISLIVFFNKNYYWQYLFFTQS